MARLYYDEYKNKYYNPDEPYKPGVNKNWLDIQRGFHRISTEQLETTEGLTLGLGTEDETSLTAAELKELKEGGLKSIIITNTINESDYVFNYDFSGLENANLIIMKSIDISGGDGTANTITIAKTLTFYPEPGTASAVIFESGVTYNDETNPPQIDTIDFRGDFLLGESLYYITTDNKLAYETFA